MTPGQPGSRRLQFCIVRDNASQMRWIEEPKACPVDGMNRRHYRNAPATVHTLAMTGLPTAAPSGHASAAQEHRGFSTISTIRQGVPMRCIHNPHTDPAFNLAAEEWLLRHTDTDIFMLWRNSPAVIVGRNQNTASEIDEEFVRERGITVIRRLTGGGAVFHDLGNVNFTFIQLGHQSRQLDFHRFTAPILEALQALGVNCQFEGRNDLVIDGQKFSGNAQLMEKDRVLHHGTLLFSAQMADLSGALKINRAKYVDRAVKSVAKRVTNISSHLASPMIVDDFIGHVMRHVAAESSDTLGHFRPEELAGIEALVDAKYATWDWNFGASPAYGFTRSTRTRGGVVEAHLDVKHGHIRSARIFGDFFGVRPIGELEILLNGCRHDRKALEECLEHVHIESYIRDLDLPNFVHCLL